MKPAPSGSPPPVPDAARLPGLFGAVWLLQAVLAAIGWDHTLLGDFEFRQVQTAIAARFYPGDAFRLDYETPLLGPPWQIPLEFPAYQAAVAWLSAFTGLPLDPAGRLVSWLAFQLSLPAFFLAMGAAGIPRPHRWLCATLLLASPLYLFFSRAFLIESTALCFSAWFLAGLGRWVTGGSARWLAVAAVAGALGAATKPTTLFVFGVAAALLLARERRTGGGPWLRRLAGAAAAALPAAAAGLAWIAHSALVRARNPDAGILADHFGYWTFGDLAQRLSAAYWTRTLGVWADGLVPQAGLALALYFLARLRPAATPVALGAFAAFLSGQLVFSNLYFVHAYYFYASGVFLVVAVGLMLAAHFDDPSAPRWLRWAPLLAVLALQLHAYARDYLPAQRENRPPTELTRVLATLTGPDDTLVVLGQDWNGSIPYYAGRRALMLAAGRERDPASIARSVGRLDPGRVGAVVLFGHMRRDPGFLALALGALDLGPVPLLKGRDPQVCVWVPQSRQAAARARLPAGLLATLDVVAPPAPPAGPATLGPREISQHRAFGQFSPAPERATGEYSLGAVDGATIVNAHPPSELVFRPTTAPRRLHLRFGIHAAAFASPTGRTDGVEFAVVLARPDGSEETLFSRVLDPANQAADAGTVEAHVRLPELWPGGELRVRTLIGPRANASYDWAYWEKISIE